MNILCILYFYTFYEYDRIICTYFECNNLNMCYLIDEYYYMFNISVCYTVKASTRDDIDIYRVTELYNSGCNIIVMDAQNGIPLLRICLLNLHAVYYCFSVLILSKYYHWYGKYCILYVKPYFYTSRHSTKCIYVSDCRIIIPLKKNI